LFLLFRFCLGYDVLKACNIVVLHFDHVFTAVDLLFELVNLLHVLGILVFGGGEILVFFLLLLVFGEDLLFQLGDLGGLEPELLLQVIKFVLVFDLAVGVESAV
jgi:hypothetical protein